MGAPRSPVVNQLIRFTLTKLHEGKKVDIGCMGGHGRTGTFLALLLIRVEKLSAKAAIEAVRSRHCQNAIESRAQEDFIYAFAGERAPVRFTPQTQNKTKASPPIKYLSRKEKKEAKLARRKRRRDFRDKVRDAKKQGLTRKKFEEKGKYWSCPDCFTIKQDFDISEMRILSADAIWVSLCTLCNKTQSLVRLQVLYDELD